MKTIQWMRPVYLSVILFLVYLISGCGMPEMPDWTTQDPDEIKKMRISALTEFVEKPTQLGPIQIKAQVELVNAMDQSLKKPGKWRFELYEFVPRSSDPRGFRLILWPDMDLNNPENNKTYWKDFLRGYEFYLPMEFIPEPNKKFILEATFMAEQRRYNDLFKMQYSPDVQ